MHGHKAITSISILSLWLLSLDFSALEHLTCRYVFRNKDLAAGSSLKRLRSTAHVDPFRRASHLAALALLSSLKYLGIVVSSQHLPASETLLQSLQTRRLEFLVLRIEKRIEFLHELNRNAPSTYLRSFGITLAAKPLPSLHRLQDVASPISVLGLDRASSSAEIRSAPAAATGQRRSLLAFGTVPSRRFDVVSSHTITVSANI
ncbi:hypothetical protein B0H11DRAFT_68953 [Mycena galericulata]|nr:hypothetical protein B0H11DRAFT_68953 [Mycena galericulata]